MHFYIKSAIFICYVLGKPAPLTPLTKLVEEGDNVTKLVEEGDECSATADFSQSNLVGTQASQVLGVYSNSHFIFSWVDGGYRKMVRTNAVGETIQAGYVSASTTSWQDSSSWTDNAGSYVITNFQGGCISEKPKSPAVQELSEEALKYFNEIAKRPFSLQCVSFLDAYWAEVSTQAEFIFSFTLETMIETDMQYKGVTLRHKYDEDKVLDFGAAMDMYGLMCNRLDINNGDSSDYTLFQDKKYGISLYSRTKICEMTEKKLMNHVDVNSDGKMSMLEFLLYQYDFADPADFIERDMALGDEPSEVRNARGALGNVMKKIRAYEEKKQKLEEAAASNGGKGISALKAQNELAQLDSSPLKDELNILLITAEAKVRIAAKKYGAKSPISTVKGEKIRLGGVWWVKRDLKEKKKNYGKAQTKK